ncbi:MAG: hypothetical protein WC819_01400 [Parcubacteria group bacterium]|jgi:hypothetical protein
MEKKILTSGKVESDGKYSVSDVLMCMSNSGYLSEMKDLGLVQFADESLSSVPAAIKPVREMVAFILSKIDEGIPVAEKVNLALRLNNDCENPKIKKLLFEAMAKWTKELAQTRESESPAKE